jgi:hypothetical protein
MPQWCEEASEIRLGNVLYSEEQIRKIFATATDPNNGLSALGRQLAAAKIGIACHAPDQCISAIIAVADLTIGNLVVPPIGDGFLPPNSVNNLVVALDDYNQGRQCAPLCDE